MAPSILTHFWTGAEAPSEPKSGVWGSFHLAVPDPEVEPLSDLVMCQVHAPYSAPLGVKKGVLLLGVLQVFSRELGGA